MISLGESKKKVKGIILYFCFIISFFSTILCVMISGSLYHKAIEYAYTAAESQAMTDMRFSERSDDYVSDDYDIAGFKPVERKGVVVIISIIQFIIIVIAGGVHGNIIFRKKAWFLLRGRKME